MTAWWPAIPDISLASAREVFSNLHYDRFTYYYYHDQARLNRDPRRLETNGRLPRDRQTLPQGGA